MEQINYIRPREKLQLRGSKSLSSTELLQLIIGSGTSKTPVANLARKVSELIHSSAVDSIDFTKIQSISGMGTATACRIVAAVELGQRLKTVSDASLKKSPIEVDYRYFSQHKKLVAKYYTLGGSDQLIQVHTITVSAQESTLSLARKICTQALLDGASKVAVHIGSHGHTLESSLYESSFAYDLKTVADLLQLNLHSLALVNRSAHVLLQGGVV